jgi:hypothetical protein
MSFHLKSSLKLSLELFEEAIRRTQTVSGAKSQDGELVGSRTSLGLILRLQSPSSSTTLSPILYHLSFLTTLMPMHCNPEKNILPSVPSTDKKLSPG